MRPKFTEMPTKRTKGLSRRDKLIMEKRLEGESITQIANSVSVAPSTVFRALKRLEPELIEELRAAGLGLDKPMRKLAQLMEQKKKLQFTYQGVVIEEVEVEDNKIQLRATEILLRLHGAFDDRTEKEALARETSGFHVTIPINLDLIMDLAAVGINVTVHAYPEPIHQLLLDETQHEH